ncbi:major facilitator superfamily transporter [Niveomyces insectorum RCEF 264]|uniref:Major facilitator superfamily transporter n=1 Tax=Niveomyces insectorum RCEF 264 TaxID=1081102 RepID=A0A167UVD3_9HYPO|nr:major facilitator superfamily transporter [Niveomyces insectorum RCEF 264]
MRDPAGGHDEKQQPFVPNVGLRAAAGTAAAAAPARGAGVPAGTAASSGRDKGKETSFDGGGDNDDDDDDDTLAGSSQVDFEKGDKRFDDGNDGDDGDDVNRRLLAGPSSPASGSASDDDDNDNDTTRKAKPPKRTSGKTKNNNNHRQEHVRWRDLPEKGQLTVLTLARLSEPLVQTSLQSYMFYQLKSFRPDLPDSVIASQSGILHASFTAAQFLTAMVWGRLADSPRFGRKKVLMIGLTGTLFSCLGFGFAQSFWQALVFRSIGGATNGNVGVLRTMISEIVRERKYQSRAFLILPMTFNVGVIIGPILGGVLSDPAHSYPSLFGGNAFLERFPYAAPNVLSAFFLLSALLAVWLGLEETLDARHGKRDHGIELRRKVAALFRRGAPADAIAYTPLATHSRHVSDVSEASTVSVEMADVAVGGDGTSATAATATTTNSSSSSSSSTTKARRRLRYTQRLPFRRIFTKNVTLTLLAQSIFAFHMGTFNSLWFVFLSTPVFDPAATPAAHALPQKLPFVFTGGIGLPPREVGMAMAILGVFGILLQLLLYPAVSARLGTVRSWRLFLCCFPVTYCVVPFLSLVPSAAPPPHAKTGVAVWLAIAAVLLCHVVGRTFALPAQTILVNNCTPHPSVLGTLHGVAQSTSSLARTVGPMLCGYLYGLGLQHGLVGAVFWGLSGVAVCGFVASLLVREGNGHSIWLDGDVEDEDEE